MVGCDFSFICSNMTGKTATPDYENEEDSAKRQVCVYYV